MILFDTDILIDVGRDVDVAKACLERFITREPIGISIVTKMELLVGCRNNNELNQLDGFLEPFSVLKLNEPISNQTILLLKNYRLSHGLLIPDALIAATSIVFQASLISKNQRDFRFITELDLLPYT